MGVAGGGWDGWDGCALATAPARLNGASERNDHGAACGTCGGRAGESRGCPRARAADSGYVERRRAGAAAGLVASWLMRGRQRCE